MSSHLFTYAVGDVHGDHALLTTLLDRIHDHADGEDYRLVFLGNAIDYGLNGAAVLSALRAMELRAPDRVIALRGWHEAMMAEAQHDPQSLAIWLGHGGDATLRSFGATTLSEIPREVLDWVARRPAEWRDALRRYVSGPELADDDTAPGLHVVHGASIVRPTPAAAGNPAGRHLHRHRGRLRRPAHRGDLHGPAGRARRLLPGGGGRQLRLRALPPRAPAGAGSAHGAAPR